MIYLVDLCTEYGYGKDTWGGISRSGSFFECKTAESYDKDPLRIGYYINIMEFYET